MSPIMIRASEPPINERLFAESVSALIRHLSAEISTAVLLVAAFLIIEVVGRGEIAKEHCSAD